MLPFDKFHRWQTTCKRCTLYTMSSRCAALSLPCDHVDRGTYVGTYRVLLSYDSMQQQQQQRRKNCRKHQHAADEERFKCLRNTHFRSLWLHLHCNFKCKNPLDRRGTEHWYQKLCASSMVHTGTRCVCVWEMRYLLFYQLCVKVDPPTLYINYEFSIVFRSRTILKRKTEIFTYSVRRIAALITSLIRWHWPWTHFFFINL